MSGDTIIARFDSIPPTDTSTKPKVRQIVAIGNARSFYQMKNSKGSATEPTVNYVRGRIIDIDFQEGKVATVAVTDQATGVMIEPVTRPAADSSKTTAPPKPRPPVKVPGIRK
jgi:hypothetical protein